MGDTCIVPIYGIINGIQAINQIVRMLPLGKGDHVFDYICKLYAAANAVIALNSENYSRNDMCLEQSLDEL